MDDDLSKGPRQFRLVWQWKHTGTKGTGPWTQRYIAEGWLESLSQRWGDRIEHWIEVAAPTGEVEQEDPHRAVREPEQHLPSTDVDGSTVWRRRHHLSDATRTG